ncbi:hypothetical protein OWR29_25100 [Actinoplanes sp. Pm04-4]|uniref:Uncharacterized protein n=1 Tax=Paractinoplanes pyxinae TaxID=2997416 RepID=A0ABT4B456_9ACTN|nr:hypothetical protein [Actinoplanes pyxinae]MCY1141288.1 hypothetical protein [Actinoplanes pyxinae]
MSPRTTVVPLAFVAAALLTACGAPPEPLPTSPPYVSPSAAPISIGPSIDLPPPLPTATAPTLPAVPTTYPTLPAYPTQRLPTPRATLTTTPPETVSPTPTPSHAPKCTAKPTKPQVLALIKGKPGVPDKPLRVYQGPYCSGTWSFATVEVTGADADDLEPLMVVATGVDDTLTLVAAGSEVCIDRVQTAAPPGIRVLACGF